LRTLFCFVFNNFGIMCEKEGEYQELFTRFKKKAETLFCFCFDKRLMYVSIFTKYDNQAK
jgi:hypothetical protein